MTRFFYYQVFFQKTDFSVIPENPGCIDWVSDFVPKIGPYHLSLRRGGGWVISQKVQIPLSLFALKLLSNKIIDVEIMLSFYHDCQLKVAHWIL